MSKQTDKSLFMVSSLSASRFYQEVFSGIADYRELGNRLIRKAETAHAFRQFDIVKEVGQILFNFPLKEYSSIGLYFIGVAFNSCGNGDQDKAKGIFERVADSAPDRYKAKAILSLAAVSFNTKDYDSALYFYNETIKAAPLGSASIQAIRTIAMLKGMAGDHNRAAKDLESLCSLIKYAPPHVYFDCLNSLAVELGETGRKQEARNIIRHVIASPFAHAYPEWRETAKELREPSRAFISVPYIEYKPIEIEPREDHQASEPKQPASVLAFKLKEAPLPEKPEKVTAQELDAMTASQKRELILAALRSGEIRESEYSKLIFMLGLFEYGPSANILDLEDEVVLDDIIVIWANLIEPEQLAAVLSALRDCDSDLRRTNLIDRMIRRAFEESQTCGITEEEWRLKFECKLPKK